MFNVKINEDKKQYMYSDSSIHSKWSMYYFQSELILLLNKMLQDITLMIKTIDISIWECFEN